MPNWRMTPIACFKCGVETRNMKYCSYACAGKNQEPRVINTIERFWELVDKSGPGGCWIWRGKQSSNGYGWYTSAALPKEYRIPRQLGAYRFSYILAHGGMDTTKHIDHLCRNKLCVNPDHLEAVTMVENVMRGESIPARNARKTHCKNGHEFNDSNTYRHPKGFRVCRTCQF